MVRIGLISDIHLGPDRETRRGTQAGRLLEAFLEDMARFGPACVVDLGDRIMEVDVPTDRRHTIQVRDLLRRVEVPVFHLMGNHDVAHVPKADVCELLGLAGPYQSVSIGGHTCLFLDSTDPVVGAYGGRISERQLKWLETELMRARQPVLVFCHHPLDDQPIANNPLFRAHPEWYAVDNRRAVRDVLARSGKVKAVITGHVHWNRAVCLAGIPFFTIQGLVETWTTGDTPAGSYGKLAVGPGGVELAVEGHDPFTTRMPVPCEERPTNVGTGPHVPDGETDDGGGIRGW